MFWLLLIFCLPMLFSPVFTDATVQILVPGEIVQELNPVNFKGLCDDPPCQVAARVAGTVLLGLGCYCNDPYISAGLNPSCKPNPARYLRGLEDVEDEVVPMDFEAPVEFTLAAAVEEPVAGCTGFFLFCWIEAILGWLIGFLTLGLL